MGYHTWGNTFYCVSENYVKNKCRKEFNKLKGFIDELDVSFKELGYINTNDDSCMFIKDKDFELIKLYYEELVNRFKKETGLSLSLEDISAEIHEVYYAKSIDGIDIQKDEYLWSINDAVNMVINPLFIKLVKRKRATAVDTVCGG